MTHELNQPGNALQRSIKARSLNHCNGGKAIIITYSQCVSVALVIQYAKRMRRIELSSVAYLALQYFFTLPHKQHDSRGVWGGGGGGGVVGGGGGGVEPSNPPSVRHCNLCKKYERVNLALSLHMTDIHHRAR